MYKSPESMIKTFSRPDLNVKRVFSMKTIIRIEIEPCVILIVESLA